MPFHRVQSFLLVLLAAIILVPAVQASALAQSPTTDAPADVAQVGDSPASTTLTPADLQALQVNELGVIPVLMYHTFTTGEATNEWMRNLDDFWNDLFWLYDHDFYVISMRDLIDNTIDAPAGKHPVVLTFDDASDNQFQFVVGADGELEPSPVSAVGVLESFFAAYPDFGRGGHFAITGSYCFANTDDPAGVNTWDTHCPLKLQWLADHGYEVGNHTWTHPNLNKIDGLSVNNEVAQTAAFIDSNVQGPGNQSSVLTLPYGVMPDDGTEAASYLANGVWWSERQYVLDAIVLVDGGPMYSPSSSWFDRYRIKRFNTDPASQDYWLGKIERGEIPLYTSDGNPDTVTVPDPLPEFLQNEFDPALIAASGKDLVQYPDDGSYVEPTLTPLPTMGPGALVVTTDGGVRLRAEPTTKADPVKVLKHQTPLTVLDGPKKADGHTWWQVKLEDGTTGWVAEEFLAGPAASP